MTSILIGCILIVCVLIILIPLINKILTTQTIGIINDMLNNLEYFIGSENLVIFLCIITVILIIGLIRFFTKFFHVNNE